MPTAHVMGSCKHERDIIRRHKTPTLAPFWCDQCHKEVRCVTEARKLT